MTDSTQVLESKAVLTQVSPSPNVLKVENNLLMVKIPGIPGHFRLISLTFVLESRNGVTIITNVFINACCDFSGNTSLHSQSFQDEMHVWMADVGCDARQTSVQILPL